MDMSFFRHADFGISSRRVARIDYRVFVATLQALQLATATARAESRCGGRAPEVNPHQREPLAEILLGCQDWQEAVLARGGCFNPAFARGAETR
jgi:hypothetical protein